jgi:hypothetical protein
MLDFVPYKSRSDLGRHIPSDGIGETVVTLYTPGMGLGRK